MFDDYLYKIKERAKNPTTGANSLRGEMIGNFLTRLNADRKGKYKELSASYVASLLSYIKTNQDLKILYDKCCNARSFGAMFWYYVKGKGW